MFVARFGRWHGGGHELGLRGRGGRLFWHHFLGEIDDLADRNAPRRLLVAGKLQRVHDPPRFAPDFLHLLLGTTKNTRILLQKAERRTFQL